MRSRSAGVVAGTLPMFLVAGLIEGYFRQLVTDVGVRYAVAAVTAVLWIVYFGFRGRREAARAEAAGDPTQGFWDEGGDDGGESP